MEQTARRRSEQIEQNIGLAHLCARRFLGKGIEYDDLFSAACEGLIKAIDGFDVNRGVKLSTYAVPVILGEIKRLFRAGGSLKVSRRLKELSMKTMRQQEILSKEYGREPTVKELAVALSVSEEEIVEALLVSAPPVSLTTESEDATVQYDLPVCSHEEEVAERLSLQSVLETLPPGDQDLITLRYFQGKTQTQTAKKLHMTQVQVSRKEKKILLFLREKLQETS